MKTKPGIRFPMWIWIAAALWALIIIMPYTVKAQTAQFEVQGDLIYYHSTFPDSLQTESRLQFGCERGDINDDGKVTMADVMSLVYHVLFGRDLPDVATHTLTTDLSVHSITVTGGLDTLIYDTTWTIRHSVEEGP